MSALAQIDVVCPACGQTVLVEIVASDVELDGALRVELLPAWSHECPTSPGDGEMLVA